MDTEQIVVIAVMLLISLLFFAFGIALFVFGYKILRKGFFSRKDIHTSSGTDMNTDKIFDDMQKIFDSVRDSFPRTTGEPQKTQTQTPNYANPRPQKEPWNNKNEKEPFEKQQPIPANPLDKQPGLTLQAKNYILAGVWVVSTFLLYAMREYICNTIILYQNTAISDSAIDLILSIIFLLYFPVSLGLFVYISRRIHKSQPQYFTRGTVALKKIERRRWRVRKNHYEWRNYCVLTVALENNICVDFDAPSAIYNTVTENDIVSIIYHKKSQTSFEIINLRQHGQR